jgi:hypothetical protein
MLCSHLRSAASLKQAGKAVIDERVSDGACGFCHRIGPSCEYQQCRSNNSASEAVLPDHG